MFAPWCGSFDDAGVPQKRELAFASERLGAIEINATFSSHQKPESFANWAAETPEDFVCTVKGHQLVTHLKKLKDVEIPLANFFASGVLALGSRLGPFCWQLPGNLTCSAHRMEAFLSLLPQTPEALVALAGRADWRLKTPPFLETAGITRIRHAIKVRHASFAKPELLEQLRRHNVALVAADTAEWTGFDQTANFAYLLLQGAPGAERYSAVERSVRAGRLADIAAGRVPADALLPGPTETDPPPRDVFAFFVSMDKENAPANARAVMAELGLKGPGEQ